MCYVFVFFFFFKQKTAYEMRISDWSSDVCSSDLRPPRPRPRPTRCRPIPATPPPRTRLLPACACPSPSTSSPRLQYPPASARGQCARPRPCGSGFRPLPCEGREGLGRGVSWDQPEPWTPPPNLPLPSQGEGQQQSSRLKPLHKIRNATAPVATRARESPTPEIGRAHV